MQYKYVKDHKEILKLLFESPKIEITEAYMPTDTYFVVGYQTIEGHVLPVPNASVVIGCFTTSWGRVLLNSVLQKLGERVSVVRYHMLLSYIHAIYDGLLRY